MTYISSNPPWGSNASHVRIEPGWYGGTVGGGGVSNANAIEERFREIERKMDFLVAELTQEKAEKIIQNPPTTNELDEHPALRRAWDELVRLRREPQVHTEMLTAAQKYLSIRKLIYGDEKS